MLEVAGIGPQEERVYRLLVATLDATPAAVSEQLTIAPDEAAVLLESLRAKGLASVVSASSQDPAGHSPRYTPMPPDVGFDPLLLGRQEALDGARSAVAKLTEDYRASARRRDAAQLVEVISGVAAIRQQLANLQRGARDEIVWFCRAGHVAMPSSDNTEEFEMLAKGVRYRVIYEQALLEEPGMIENVADGIRQGEIARATSSLPVRLAVADRSIAICPLVPTAGGPGEPTAALVRESNLLGALLALFESYWDRASPLQLTVDNGPQKRIAPLAVGAGGSLAADERYLLSLLVAGVTDKAIATQLHVSQRTVQRRVAELMARANAQTRMQLAWQVTRLGWLADAAPARLASPPPQALAARP